MGSMSHKQLSRKQMIWIGVVALFLVVAFGSCGKSTNTAAAPDPYKDKFLNVAAVLDAATIQLGDGRRIRQLGILAPEAGTCEAKQALMVAKTMVGPAHPVSLEFEPGVGVDEYGNQWAYIKYGPNYGGTQIDDFGIDSARRGWVSAYSQSPDSQEYESAILAGFTTAENSAAGRWSSFCHPVKPAPAVPVTPTSPTNTTDVDIDVHHHNLPDGALTGGYCRRKWWC